MPWHWHRFSGRPEPTPAQLLEELTDIVDTGNYRRLLAAADDGRLVRALHMAGKNIWPEPDDTPPDGERETTVLRPVAEALLLSPGTAWWSSPCASADQHLADARDVAGDTYEPPDPDVRGELSRTMADEAEREERLNRHDPVGFPPAARMENVDWCDWSCPPTPWRTSRSVPGRPALPALSLIWDWHGDGSHHPRYWDLHVDRAARIYEITGTDAWVSLVDRYPRDVTLTRRGPWWEPTGWTGAWLLPDWAVMAADFDGVHLTVTGFLEASQRLLPVTGGRTTLVRWEPDETFWLNPVVRLDSSPKDWHEDDDWIDDWTRVTIGDDGSLSMRPEDT